MSEQDTTMVVQQAYNNFQTGDIDALISLMSDDVTWRLPEIEGVPFAGSRSTRAGVADFFQILATDQESVRFEPREMIAQGDKVASIGSYTWKVKSTDREYQCDFCHVFTIRDGKIVAFEEFTDTAAAAAAHQKAMSA